MNFSTILKGAAVAASFALVVSEASAQLPVRTRTLQLLGSTSGALTQQAAATTTPYSVTWPSAAHTDGTNAYLSSAAAGGNSTLSWVEINGSLVDGTGAAGQVAYFTDGNTLASSPDFAFAGSTVTIGSGTNTGVLTLNDVGGGNTVSINPGSQTGNVTATLDAPAGAGPHSVTIPVSTNAAGAGTTSYIATSNGDGTFTWVANPTSGMQRGTVNGNVGAFTTTITVTGTPDLTNDVIIVSTSNSAGTGNILQVTAVAANAITVSSTAPFDANDRISWVWIAIP